MTLTKKIGSLLLLLTMGSLAGTAIFAIFFSRTALDGIFLLATNVQQGIIHQVQVQTFRIADGESSLREKQLQDIRLADTLLLSLESGGKSPTERPVFLLTRVTALAQADPTAREVINALEAEMPVPPPELRDRISRIRSVWSEIKHPLEIIASRDASDPEARASFQLVKKAFPELTIEARLTMGTIGNRISAARERMFASLVLLALASIMLFAIGLWFTKRYISRPISLIEKASEAIRTGDYSQRVPIISSDEIAALGRTVNAMCVEMEKSMERYRELFENANDIVYTTDLEGNFLTVNRAVERVCGYERKELLAMNINQLVLPGSVDLSQQTLEARTSREQPATIHPVQIRRKDGRTVALEVSTRLIYEDGVPAAVQCIGRDVSERRKLEEQLWLSQKMEAVGRLAGGIAHEFGNVLTIITGYCTLLTGSLKNEDPLRREVEGIQRAAQRATSLIRHLLGFSKGQVFRPRVLALDQALQEITGMLQRLIGEDIRLTTWCDPQLGRVRFDPAQLEQVMVNLTLNSRDAMPGGGKLDIRADNVDIEDGQYVRIIVSDTGSGIAPSVLPQIFEPFFSTKERGTGLGLSTVYGIVRQSEGKVTVESAVNRGTTFTILLPRLEEPAELPADGEKQPATFGSETILLVEDEEDVRWLVRHMLQANGYRVLEARDQQEAIELCGKQDAPIDIMLTDVVMPAMSGPELVGLVKPIQPKMKVLYMSGHTQDKFGSAALESAANFIQKPLTPEALTAKVREVLDFPGNGHPG